MKIIEAMKQIKENDDKIRDLQGKIAKNCANLSIEKPEYPDVKKKITGWLQSVEDLCSENVRLQEAITRTNLMTLVDIELGEKTVTKTITQWILWRRTYAEVCRVTWGQLNDRGLQPGAMRSSVSETPVDVTVERHFDPEIRDAKLELYRSEPMRIDRTLEIVNATTDLVE